MNQFAPTKIIGIGRNYAKHARELGNDVPESPIAFLKPPSSVVTSGQVIVRPDFQRVDYEGELAVVIGKRCVRVGGDDALNYVEGYTCANDITVRDLQRKGGPWSVAKGMDTFCPLGPAIVANLNPQNVLLRTTVNGEVRQEANTSEMVFSVAEIISYLSSVMTLEIGDVILTGTPAGVGNLDIGDEVSVTIEGIGTLTNKVVSHG